MSCDMTIQPKLKSFDCNGANNLIKKIKLYRTDYNGEFPLKALLEQVKDDPGLSISLIPIINDDIPIIEFNYTCEITSWFYEPIIFKINIQ